MDKTEVGAILAQNLTALMKLKGWSAQTLADKTGISKSTINYIKNAEVSPQVDNLQAIARAFGLSGWMLLVENLDVHLKGAPLNQIVTRFLAADQQGRAAILRLALSEANYAQKADRRANS